MKIKFTFNPNTSEAKDFEMGRLAPGDSYRVQNYILHHNKNAIGDERGYLTSRPVEINMTFETQPKSVTNEFKDLVFSNLGSHLVLSITTLDRYFYAVITTLDTQRGRKDSCGDDTYNISLSLIAFSSSELDLTEANNVRTILR